MSDPSKVRMTGPLAVYAPGYAAELSRQGYRRNAAANQLQLVAHLSRWLDGGALDPARLTPTVAEAFLAARRSEGYCLWLSPKALAPLLRYLRGLGVVPLPPEPVMSAPEALLAEFCRYLIRERGLTVSSTRGYADMVRPFIVARAAGDGVDLTGVTPGDITGFVLATCPGRSSGSAKLLVTSLRSLLRFLYVDGRITAPLASAVPSVAGWRLAGLPQSLEPEEVRRLVGSCDRRTRTGRRDFAILVLLVRLGLRAGEVCTLSLDDIDWRAGEVVIRGKGNRLERLPLPADVGEAVAGYLRRGRPTTAAGRVVFVRVKAPHQQLTSPAITHVVEAAAQRAGLGRFGAHRLRHTAATQMVRGGAALPDVVQVLRHRLFTTTAIYAKVDREALRRLARPWPVDAA